MDLTALEDRTPRGIAAALGRAVRSGELAPGERLPTVRDVASELGVSPATVSAAWQALRRAGLVEARGRAGTFVRLAPERRLSPRVAGLRGSSDDGVRLDLSRGTPDPTLLPALGPALRRVSERATRSPSTAGYQEEPVVPELRAALMATWPAPVEQVTVVDGATDGVARVLEHVVSYSDRVVLETPGFPQFYDLVEALGAEVVPVELDGSGVRPESLRRALDAKPVAVVLQPRAHNPTGVSTPPARAAVLARLLRRAESTPWVVEDDHSGAISTAPDVSLGRWLPDRVVHVRSFSKTHGPDLRIAALGGPDGLVDGLVARRMLGPAWTSRMLQSILLDLLTTDESVDEVAAARAAYHQRQQAFVEALAGHGIDVALPDGLNLWLPVRDERAALLHLAAAGIRVAAGSPFLAAGANGAFVRVTSALVEPHDVVDVAAALAAATLVGA